MRSKVAEVKVHESAAMASAEPYLPGEENFSLSALKLSQDTAL